MTAAGQGIYAWRTFSDEASMRSTFLLCAFLVTAAASELRADSATAAIEHPSAGSWPSFGRGYDNRRFSPLRQSDSSNVLRLAGAWTFRSGVKATFQTTPLVVDKTMYRSLAYNHVTAGKLVFVGEGSGEFDAFAAAGGALLWQSKHAAGVNAPPITYQVDGVQYVAVAIGGNQLFGFPQGDDVAVFALGK